MRRPWTLLGAVLAAGALSLAPGPARAAECRVGRVAEAPQGMRVLVTSLGLLADVPATGLALPVTLGDGGSFALDLSGFPKTQFTIVGVLSELDFPPSVFSGTIDAGGNVVVRQVQIDFVTFFGGTPLALGTTADLSTGIEPVTIAGTDHVTEGVPLDFATGNLVLQGQNVLPDAPGAGTAVSSGLALECTLSPIPDPATLPAAPKLVKARGKGKVASSAGTVEGDTLTLTATFKQGARTADPLTEDLFVRVRDAEKGNLLLVHVLPGGLAARGKRLSLSDTDGTKLRVLAGRKESSAGAAELGGSLVVKRTKKSLVLTLKQEGIDLSTLGAAATVTVVIGDASASDAVTVVRRTGKVLLK